MSSTSNLAHDLPTLLRRAYSMLNDIPCSNLLGYAKFDMHYIHNRDRGYGRSVYFTPTLVPWHVGFVGKILPASYGTRHCSIGSVQVCQSYVAYICH